MRILAVGIYLGTLAAFTQHGTTTVPEALAPSKACGVLGDDIIVRLYGEGSSYKIESQDYCVGPEKSASKLSFKEFIKTQISKQELQGKLGPISKEDIQASSSDQIEGVVATVCVKDGVHVPREGSLFHPELSQNDPSKSPCSSEKDCRTVQAQGRNCRG